MSKPVFVLVTAEDCHHCDDFKKSRTGWPAIKSGLVKNGRVKIVEIHLPTMTSRPSDTYHPELAKYIGWTPTMMLFPGSSWRNHSSELKGVVKNGEFVNGEIDVTGKVNFSKNAMVGWVNDNLDNNPLFNGPPVEAPPTILITDSSKNNSGNESIFPDGRRIKVPTAGYYKMRNGKVPRNRNKL